MHQSQGEPVAFFDEREVGRYPSITEAMEVVEALREGGLSATFLESPAGPPEEGASCPAMVLVEDAADRLRALEVLGREAAVTRTSQERDRLWLEVGLVLLVVWFPRTFEAVLGYIWPVPGELEGPIPFSLEAELWVFSTTLPVIGLVLYLLWRHPRPARDFGLGRPRILALTLGTLVLLLATDVVERLSSGMLLLFLPSPPPFPMYAPPPDLSAYLVSFAATLAAVAAEELTFRSYLLPHLRTLFGQRWTAVVVSALFFGVAHLYQGLQGVVFTTALGILFGATFFLSGRVWPLILAHLIWNLMIFW
jgi:membrane protease YdiL (CAAX protease family)